MAEQKDKIGLFHLVTAAPKFIHKSEQLLASVLNMDAEALHDALQLLGIQLRRSVRRERSLCNGSFCPGIAQECEDCLACIRMAREKCQKPPDTMTE